MSTSNPIAGTSSERSPRVHAIRSIITVLPILAIAVLAGLAAAGTTPIGSTGASASSPEASTAAGVEPAPLESRAQPTPRPARAEATEPGAPIRVEPAPPSAARLVTAAVERIVDTRNAESVEPLSTIDLPAPGPSVTGLVFSVSLIGSERAGTVTIEGPAGTVEALTVDGPGATTTNGFVVIPASGPSRLHNPTGGGIVVDLVGRFETSGPSSAGRLLAVEPVRLVKLVTATDGREIDFGLETGEATGQADPSAALVVISADVGSDGGRLAIGPSGTGPTQMVMWGPPAGENRQRTVVALVTPGADGRVAIRYDGGSVLAVDLIAQVTGEGAAQTSAGLFLPATTIETIEADVPSGTTVVGPAVPATASVLVGVRAQGGDITTGLPPVERARDLTVAAGRTVGTVLPVGPGPDGRAGIVVASAADLSATIQPLGYLLAGTP